MRVKICGITNEADALAAAEAGAQMLGYNFYPPSPRSLTTSSCRKIQTAVRQAGFEVISVAVTVNLNFDQVCSILDECRLDLAQLSGNESPQLVQQLGERALKAIRPKPNVDILEVAGEYLHKMDPPAFLIDAPLRSGYGGTGDITDWSQARRLGENFPILLAGGLTPGNVASAIKQVKPWGVDVASGVESQPRIKDPAKIQEFIKNAQRAGELLASEN